MAKRQAPPPSLDRTGTQAAVYPSEAALWTVGPPINDPSPGGYGVADDDLDYQAPAGMSSRAVQAQQDYLHEQINGQTSNEAVAETWVNNAVHGPQGFGDWNVQPYETGHTQNIVSDPSTEQGWGVGPARRWAHYPKVESPNPYRNFGAHLRNGALPWVVADSSLYERSQLAWEQQWDQFKFRSPVNPVIGVAPSVPFVQTVPTYGGGPSPYPGVDIPYEDSGIYG